MPKNKKSLHKGAGHRSRLRRRFMEAGLDAFLDYEIIELLLTLGTPRQDCKGRAKELIKKFGGLRQVLDAPVDELRQIKGIGPMNPFGLKLFQEISKRYAREKVLEKILLSNPKAVYNFLQELIGREKQEHFIILSLNAKNQLIGIADTSKGTLNENLVHPREIFREAIQFSAANVIAAHNHPSGDPEPSDEDLRLTKRLIKAGEILGIPLLDHIIISRNGYYSLKEKNHI